MRIEDFLEDPSEVKEDEEELGANIRERRFLVDSNFHRWRLDSFLANRLGRLSRTRANQIARFGDLRVEPPRAVKPSMRLRWGDVVILRERLDDEQVQDEEVHWIYRDDAILALSKPAGMLTHETAGQRLNTVDAYLRRQGYPDAESAHRLDRETSGVMLCAARRDLVRPLRELFATDHPTKTYRALVLDPHNVWSPGAKRTITDPLGPAGGPLAVRMGHGDLSATTHVTAIARHVHPTFGPMADLEVRIETGRQHQIRVHLAMQGTPIAGDKLYGQTDQFFMDICDNPGDPALLSQLPFTRHALHAWRLTIPHPITGVTLILVAPPPEDVWPQERAEG
jgi:RluA family pseudouridine synthase